MAAEPRRRPMRADVRAEILATAIAAFERTGYAGTSVDAIAREAGYTKGAVYSNFGGKPELFGEACRERLASIGADLLARVEPALDAATDRASLVRPLAEAVTAATLDTPLRWQILLNEFRTVALRDEAVGRVYAELSRARVESLARLLGSNRHLGRLSSAALDRAALILLNLINALALEHAAAPEVVDRDTVSDIAAAFLGAVLP